MASQDLESPTQSVGPEYVPETKKPTATVSTEVKFKNVHILQQSPQLIALLTLVQFDALSTVMPILISYQYDPGQEHSTS